MHAVQVVGIAFVAMAAAALVGGATLAVQGAHAADDACTSDCAGRDARADRMAGAGMTLMIGGFVTLLAGGGIVLISDHTDAVHPRAKVIQALRRPAAPTGAGAPLAEQERDVATVKEPETPILRHQLGDIDALFQHRRK